MLTAITRSPGTQLAQCELTHLVRQPIDADRAIAQHRAYQAALRDEGLRVVELPADSALPDGVFVEDTAVVLDEVAVLTSPTPPSRRGERAVIEAELTAFRSLQRLPADAFLEGGDVLRVGRTLFVGQSSRTGEAGLRALEENVRPFGYSVVPVRVTGCLHLKSAVTYIGLETVLVNPAWVDVDAFSRWQCVPVAKEEPYGANALLVAGLVHLAESAPITRRKLDALGFSTAAIDTSEFEKAEAALTCLSLVFDDRS